MPYIHLILNVNGQEYVGHGEHFPSFPSFKWWQIKCVALNSALFVSCSWNVQLYGLRQSVVLFFLTSWIFFFLFNLSCLHASMFFTLEEGKKKKCTENTLKLYCYYWPQCSFFTATEHRSRGIICRASQVSASLLRSQWGELALAVGTTGTPVTVSF